MSAIYFHSRGEKLATRAYVSGAERAYMGEMCRRLTDQAFDLRRFASPELVARLRSMIPSRHRLAESLRTPLHPDKHADADKFGSSFLLHFGGSFDDGILEWKGRALNSFWIQLNTALALGSDAVKLAARLHGQCEIHAWVAEANRPWLAGIVEDGLRRNVLRSVLVRADEQRFPLGWDRVVETLRAVDVAGPIVTSYSVCDSFPNAYVAEIEDRDAFDCRPGNDRWDLAIVKLRAGSRRLELKPDDWDDFVFGDGVSALDLVSDDYASILDRKLEEAYS